jgi:hypothetical protein
MSACIVSVVYTSARAQDTSDAPDVLLFDGPTLVQVKELVAQGDPDKTAALNELLAEAEEAMQVQPVDMTNKPQTPPSGDKHDYMSLSPYWWPDPDSPDGLPYIRRDGEVNPQRYEFDMPKIDAVSGAVRVLGPAYYFTDDERYAEHAAKLLRSLLIDPETRMNPSLKYAQMRPGHELNHSGIIETVRFRWMIDAITLLKGSGAWTDEDHAAVQDWFRDYVTWLRTSEQGVAESQSENNHGSWYAEQVVLYSLFVGDEQPAREVLATIPDRIAYQIESDGSQPHELVRTRSFHYCDFNVRALLDLAHLGRRLGEDLYGYETVDGRSIRAALEFMLPHATGEAEWDHEQIAPINWSNFAHALTRAAVAYDEPRYEQLKSKLPNDGKLEPEFDLMEKRLSP